MYTIPHFYNFRNIIKPLPTFEKEMKQNSNPTISPSIYNYTNLLFDRWEEIFKYPILTTAIVDRLTFKSHIINMSGDSYRIKETKEWLKEKSNRSI